MKKEFVLNRPGIDEAVEVLDKWLKRAGISKSTEIRIRLAMEELLLRIYEHYDGEIVGELQTKRGLGTTRFIIETARKTPVDHSRLRDTSALQPRQRCLFLLYLPVFSYLRLCSSVCWESMYSLTFSMTVVPVVATK